MSIIYMYFPWIVFLTMPCYLAYLLYLVKNIKLKMFINLFMFTLRTLGVMLRMDQDSWDTNFPFIILRIYSQNWKYEEFCKLKLWTSRMFNLVKLKNLFAFNSMETGTHKFEAIYSTLIYSVSVILPMQPKYNKSKVLHASYITCVPILW